MRTIVVIGPCSSCTKWWGNIVSAMRRDDDTVIRRSQPHGGYNEGNWVKLSDLFPSSGDRLVFVCYRDWYAVHESQRRKHSLLKGYEDIRRAYLLIFSEIQKLGCPFEIVSVESATNPSYLKKLAERYALNYSPPDEMRLEKFEGGAFDPHPRPGRIDVHYRGANQ